MFSYRQWICLAVGALVFDAPLMAQQSRAEIKYYIVANTTPPDAFVALRTNPSSSIGRRIEAMPNGTALQVLKTNSDGWWYVKVVASGNEGWALSGENDKRWIVCCANSSSVAATSSIVPTLKETPAVGELWSPAAGPPNAVSQAPAPVNQSSPEPATQDVTSDETILQQCARESGGFSGVASDPRSAEVWKCIERVQSEQASQLGDRACNEYICFFRLAYVSESTFSGSGYNLQYHVSSRASKFGNRALTNYDSILTTEDGKRIVLHETIGPVGSIFLNSGGPLTGPFGAGTNSYIVLRLPKYEVAPNEDISLSIGSRPCQTRSTDLIPCDLKWKAVEFKVAYISRTGAFRIDGTETTAPQNRREIKGSVSENIVFGDNGDVYVSSDRGKGLVYKMNLEIDFVANPSRAPKGAFGEKLLSGETCMMKSYRGRMEFKEDTLVQNLVLENTCDGNISSKLTWQVKFAPDFSSCSVVGYSGEEVSVTPDKSAYISNRVSFDKSVDCRIYAK